MPQENHVVNGCCWLNHSGGVNGDPKTTTKFIDLVREHRCIKAWFSGHFHLGQDYQDSITFPTIPRELGPYPNRGSCVFAQTSVMRAGTSRDGRQQSRLIRGNKDGFEICTIDHADGGKVRLSTQFWTGILDRNSAQFWRSHSERCPPSQVRLDATISYKDSDHEVGVYNHAFDTLEKENPNFVNVYSPTEGDECFVAYDEEGDGVSIESCTGRCGLPAKPPPCPPRSPALQRPPSPLSATPHSLHFSGWSPPLHLHPHLHPHPSHLHPIPPPPRPTPRRVDGETISWWKMSCGRVLGVYDGRLIEYEPSTLAPLGLVVGQDELAGKRVVLVGSGIPEECTVDTAETSDAVGMEGADCAEVEPEEQAVLLVDDESGAVTVIQPNEDGSYWPKIVRNKMIRMKEKRRLQAGKAFAAEELGLDEETLSGRVVSSYGPYTSIVGTAKKTGVAGLTAEPEMGGDRGEVVAAKDAEIAALKKQLEALGVAA